MQNRTNSIKMPHFQIENQVFRFVYSDYAFEAILRNDENMVDIEWNVNFIVRIVNNASFHNFRNRKK
jgi:hypothetical protein